MSITPYIKKMEKEFEMIWKGEINVAGNDGVNPVYRLSNGISAFKEFNHASLLGLISEFEKMVEGKITIKEPNDEIYSQWDLGHDAALSTLLQDLQAIKNTLK